MIVQFKQDKMELSNEKLNSSLSLLNKKRLTEETTCGIWIFKGDFLQKLANKKTYVILYGLLGCVFSASYAYFNGTITTIEKRFKIPSTNTGWLSFSQFSKKKINEKMRF